LYIFDTSTMREIFRVRGLGLVNILNKLLFNQNEFIKHYC